MTTRFLRLVPAAAVAVLLAACASDGSGMLSTASVTSSSADAPAVTAARPKADPQCVALASQIDALRREGTIDRLEKVAVGKTENVQVKRSALAKQAELNKANVEFQIKCAPRIPTTQEAAAPAQSVVAATAAPAAAKAATKAPAPSGVTVATPKAQ